MQDVMRGIFPLLEKLVFELDLNKGEAMVEDVEEHFRKSERECKNLEIRARLSWKQCELNGEWREERLRVVGSRHYAGSHRPWQRDWLPVWLQSDKKSWRALSREDPPGCYIGYRRQEGGRKPVWGLLFCST